MQRQLPSHCSNINSAWYMKLNVLSFPLSCPNLPSIQRAGRSLIPPHLYTLRQSHEFTAKDKNMLNTQLQSQSLTGTEATDLEACLPSNRINRSLQLAQGKGRTWVQCRPLRWSLGYKKPTRSKTSVAQVRASPLGYGMHHRHTCKWSSSAEE